MSRMTIPIVGNVQFRFAKKAPIEEKSWIILKWEILNTWSYKFLSVWCLILDVHMIANLRYAHHLSIPASWLHHEASRNSILHWQRWDSIG
jgi:hypothetical protein